jgi:small subunit ribosomal protein S20
MPISRSAKKSLRKSVKNRKTNVSFKEKVKSVLKKYLLKPSEAGLKEVFSMLDKSQKKQIFHKNKVARLKSRMSKKLVKPTPEIKPVAKSVKAKPVAARALAGKKVK